MTRGVRVALIAAAVTSACARTGDADLSAMTREQHEAFFPIGAGSHAANCDTCHGAFDTFTKFNCTTCHEHGRAEMDAAHAGIVAGYAYGPSTCYACHPKGAADGFNHEAYFAIGAGTSHAGISCGTCHPDASNRKQVDCTSCHTKPKTDPQHSGIGGYAWESGACVSCHKGGAAIEHLRFPIGAGQKHASISCSSCHPVADDKKQFDCISCHEHDRASTDLNHTGVPDYEYASAGCYRCHPDSSVTGLVDHSPYFPTGAGTTHFGASCASCHVVPGNRKVIDCGSCHFATPTLGQHAEVGGYEFTGAACIRCHADGQVDRVALHLPFDIGLLTKHYRESCLGCHPSFRLDKSWAGDFTLPKISCVACHDRARMDAEHVGDVGYISGNYPSCVQSGCHANGGNPGD